MKKKDKKILEDIQMKANALYGDKLWKKQPKADAMIEVLDKSLTEQRHRFTKEELSKLQSIKDSHILEGEEIVVDQEVLKDMDDFMGKEITKAIEEGRLTHPEKDPYYKKIKQLRNKHARRNYEDKARSDKGTKGSGSKGDSNKGDSA